MVTIADVNEIRPRMGNEINASAFVPHTANIQKAWDWGKNAHAGQLRLSGEPYFETHCAWVATRISVSTGASGTRRCTRSSISLSYLNSLFQVKGRLRMKRIALSPVKAYKEFTNERKQLGQTRST